MVGGGLLPLASVPPGTQSATFRHPDSIAAFGAGSWAVVRSSGLYYTTALSPDPIVWTEIGSATDPGPCAVQVALS